MAPRHLAAAAGLAVAALLAACGDRDVAEESAGDATAMTGIAADASAEGASASATVTTTGPNAAGPPVPGVGADTPVSSDPAARAVEPPGSPDINAATTSVPNSGSATTPP